MKNKGWLDKDSKNSLQFEPQMVIDIDSVYKNKEKLNISLNFHTENSVVLKTEDKSKKDFSMK